MYMGHVKLPIAPNFNDLKNLIPTIHFKNAYTNIESV
jgi:hypothetical protein